MAHPPVVVTVSHALGREQALLRIKDGIEQFRRMPTPIQIEQEIWTGYHLDFRLRALGQSCVGTIDVFSDSIRLDVTLTGILGFAAKSALALAKKRAKTLLGTS
jgi:hypothetical protein